MEQISQLHFEFLPIVHPQDVGDTIEEQFRAFHEANPHVFQLLRALALDYQRSGHSHCGMKMLYEVLRYRSGLYTRGDPYRLNNNYTALYARLLMETTRELVGFFELRERRAE